MKISLSLIFIFFISASTFSQAKPSALPPINWQLMDWQKDGFPGISLEKAYSTLLLHKIPLKKIIVAIIDDGFDSTQPDLAGMEWTNKKEIPGNGIDDDKNGYIDDVHGWNFVGNVQKESVEEIREYIRLRGKFENAKDTTAIKADPQYAYWQIIFAADNDKMNKLQQAVVRLGKVLNALHAVQDYWSKRLSSDSVSFAHLKEVQPVDADSNEIKAREFILTFKNWVKNRSDSTKMLTLIEALQPLYDEHSLALEVADTILQKNDPAYFRRTILHDDPYSNSVKNYGNGNTFPDDQHGTECAGIIAALRNNGIGGNGITNSVAIMPLRINAMGHDADEWDKDVANAIRYAVDNGAQVISMSFGKYYSPQKEWVKEAIQYAARKGVLLVHGAGNDAAKTDSIIFYPQEYYSANEKATNMITVGASTFDSSLVGDFSNYGKRSVDVFAPGVSLYMPILHGGYERGYGTSFACPMVAGLAAFIWSYYPHFTYLQVRQCIEKSATPIDIMVIKPGTTDKVAFNSLSKTGGIVNAYKAIEEAEKIAREK
jgi:cell wall-associated protease